MKKNTLYLTTPIYYVNDYPHVGHAYTTIATDILARWERLNGKNVFFLTGTDEHGAKICEAAQKNNQQPQTFCDGIVEGFRLAWKNLSIDNSDFIRTTDQRHETAVQKFLSVLYEKGFIYNSLYKGQYCVGCEKFISESDLDETGCCPDHKMKPAHHEEENYFFKLSAFQNQLIDILSNENHPQHIVVLPRERRNEILGKLKIGLEDISISRAALPWGIALPFDKKQTVYVWVDALINYISAIGYGSTTIGDKSDKKAQTLNFNTWWPADLHLMAKDILWFHSVIWPAMLLAAGLALPKKIFAHGFFTVDGNKMSKTIGNVIRPDQLIEKFGVDATRYLTVSLFPFGSDGDISWQALTDKYNVELANNFGNLISRTLSMTQKYFEGTVPAGELVAPPGAADASLHATEHIPDLIVRVQKILADIAESLDGLGFHKVTERIQCAITLVNQQIEQDAPWKMAKESNQRLGSVMNSYLQASALITIYLVPFMPAVCQKVWEALGMTEPVATAAQHHFTSPETAGTLVRTGAVITNPGILFPRIQEKVNPVKK
ncbi:MAG: methionine--tRNA ligase [Endomicrobiales bacterium]